jgi:hypothetical protein
LSAAIIVNGCKCDGCWIAKRKLDMGLTDQSCQCDEEARTYAYRRTDGITEHSNGYCLVCLTRHPDTVEVLHEITSSSAEVLS